MGTILQDMMGMLSRKKVVTPKTDDYITLARYASAQERMKPHPKIETELVTMGSIKTFVNDVSTLPTGLISTKISLTAAQIKSLGTTPIDAIAAPGAGKYIRVSDCDGWLTWGSVAFDDNPITLTAVGAGDVQALDDYSLLAKTSTTNNRFGVYETVDPYVENAKLQVTGTDSVLTGDSTVDIYISYEIITL
tara:strand:+ start:19 stop:594 length:576 start_codon:yes stop_codon:yes gene_type:complete